MLISSFLSKEGQILLYKRYLLRLNSQNNLHEKHVDEELLRSWNNIRICMFVILSNIIT